MKKYIGFLVLSLMAPSFVLAGNHPMAGCGLFYVVFGANHPQQGWQIGQGLAEALVSGAMGMSFSMTSGTSGCTPDGAPKFVRSAEIFAEANFDDLKKEIASGQGKYITTFASLIGAAPENVPAVTEVMKQEYSSLFPTDTTSHSDLMLNLSKVMGGHRNLIG